MPTAHYIPLSALADNGLHPSNPNRTTETAPRLDVNVPRSNPHLASNNIIGNDPRTMDVTTNGLSLLVSQPNSDSTVNNDQQDKKNYTRFNGRFEDLKAYKEKYGHVNVSRKTDKSLYNWCSNIRSARRNPETCKRKLTQKRIAALDAIGFDWRSEKSSRTREKSISFIDRVEALRQYKEKHGHLNVTFKANKSLNNWCYNIRNTRSKSGEGTMKLTQERIEALDAIGFDWRLSKSVLRPFDSLGGDADKSSDKSEENNNTVQNWEDGRQHDYLERVEIPNASVTFLEISIDSLTVEEKIMFDAIERSISAAEELEQTEATI